MERKKRRGPHALKVIALVMLGLLTAFVLFFAVKLFNLDAWHEFDPEKILGADQTLILYDGEDQEITRLHALEDRIYITIDQVPVLVQKAFVSAEDARFYEHSGIDIIRIFGAAWEDIKAGGYVQGASTISQQLVKLSHLTPEKTITRKLEEAVLAYQMERQYSKDEIMQMYLNYVYFGGGYYGIEAAARGYFGVSASKLSVAQGAMLAGILKAPSRYAPHLNLEASLSRRNTVLELMEKYGYLSGEELQKAKGEQPVILHTGATDYKRGYYVDSVMAEAGEVLGVDSSSLLTEGYRIYTAMDPGLQARCEEIFAKDEFFASADCEAAMVVQKAGTGYVCALMGGRKSDTAMALNRATHMKRQPGSVIKPVIAYAPALEHNGYTAATLILDEQTSFGEYSPKNFGNKYYGWVTLREAVKRSLNVPAVKVLQSIGVSAGKEFAQSCGIGFAASDDNLSLALGGFTYGVSPMDVAGAYNAFASGGLYNRPTLIRRITDAKGTVLYEYQAQDKRVLSEQNCYILTSMLQSAISEGTGHRLGELNIPLAGKTGTVGESGGNRDAWMAAYNPDYAAAVWMGYDDSTVGSLPSEATGGKYPALILSELYSGIYEQRPAPEFSEVGGIETCRLDRYSLETLHVVALANALTPKSQQVSEIFAQGTAPRGESSYWVVPAPPKDFTVKLNFAGNVSVSYTTRDTFVRYRLFRKTGGGEEKCIQEYSGAVKTVRYTDEDVLPGVSYTYYVLPVHLRLNVGAQQVSGPATGSQTVVIPGAQPGQPTPSQPPQSEPPPTDTPSQATQSPEITPTQTPEATNAGEPTPTLPQLDLTGGG